MAREPKTGGGHSEILCLGTSLRAELKSLDKYEKGQACMGILLKNPLRFVSLFWWLADEPEFVTGVHLPFHDFAGLDVDGCGQREWQVYVTLGDGLFAADGLNFGRVVHVFDSS